MIYINKPSVFNSKFEVVSCFVEYNQKILLLHRQDHKQQGGTWGVPAGKVDFNENILDTMQREIQEETGIILESSQLNYFTKIFVKYVDYDFIYHIYHTNLVYKPEIILSPTEHKNYQWIDPKQALNMNLIQDLDQCIDLFYNY
jgi:8-oxo-dGTP diphosphatase